MLTIVQATTESEIRAVRELIREYTAWAFGLTENNDEAPTFQGLDQELRELPGIYAPPTGSLLLASLDGEPAGCVALKGHDATTAELKRLYVRPTFRGHRIGEQLIAALLADARKLGYRRVILDSHALMTRAHALYEAAGFHRVEAPREFPEHLKPIVVFMEITLD